MDFDNQTSSQPRAVATAETESPPLEKHLGIRTCCRRTGLGISYCLVVLFSVFLFFLVVRALVLITIEVPMTCFLYEAALSRFITMIALAAWSSSTFLACMTWGLCRWWCARAWTNQLAVLASVCFVGVPLLWLLVMTGIALSTPTPPDPLCSSCFLVSISLASGLLVCILACWLGRQCYIQRHRRQHVVQPLPAPIFHIRHPAQNTTLV